MATPLRGCDGSTTVMPQTWLRHFSQKGLFIRRGFCNMTSILRQYLGIATFLECELYALPRRLLAPRNHAVAAFLWHRSNPPILQIICFLQHSDGAILLKYYYCRITALQTPRPMVQRSLQLHFCSITVSAVPTSRDCRVQSFYNVSPMLQCSCFVAKVLSDGVAEFLRPCVRRVASPTSLLQLLAFTDGISASRRHFSNGVHAQYGHNP